MSVNIILKNQIILLIANFQCCKQISRLKSGLENQSRISLRLKHIVLTRGYLDSFDRALGLDLGKVFIFTVDIVVLNELFYVYQIGCYWSTRGSENRIVCLLLGLFRYCWDVIPTVPTVDYFFQIKHIAEVSLKFVLAHSDFLNLILQRFHWRRSL